MGSVTLLIGNNHAAVHRCYESRFSPDTQTGHDAVLTQCGWKFSGAQLVDNDLPHENLSANSFSDAISGNQIWRM